MPPKITNARLYAIDTEEVRKLRERRAARLETRRLFLESQQRQSYRNEYDRLTGELGNIPAVQRESGLRVANLTALVINRRHKQLSKMYKEIANPPKHKIEK